MVIQCLGMILPIRGKMVGAPGHGTLNFCQLHMHLIYQVIQAVTFLSPSWRSQTTLERVTISPSQKGHELAESPGIVGIYWGFLSLWKKKAPKGGFFSAGKRGPTKSKWREGPWPGNLSTRKVLGSRCFFPKEWFQREPQHTPVEHTPGTSPNPQIKWKEFRNMNCWFWVWGMFQGYVGKVLEWLISVACYSSEICCPKQRSSQFMSISYRLNFNQKSSSTCLQT